VVSSAGAPFRHREGANPSGSVRRRRRGQAGGGTGPEGHLSLLPRLVAVSNYSRIGLVRVAVQRPQGRRAWTGTWRTSEVRTWSRGGTQVTTAGRGQGAPRRACPYCDGYGQVTMGWPENVCWNENAYPCSRYGALRQLMRFEGVGQRIYTVIGKVEECDG
jgi:hypothetical protein